MFFTATEDGKRLMDTPFMSEKKGPTFKKGMTFLEFPDLLNGVLASLQFVDVRITKMTPSELGDAKALRMDFTMKTENGPNLKGFARMANKNDRLLFILFYSEESTYYPLVAPEAERITAELRLLK
ncbi:MAG: hypothetical protein HQL45_10065 [Alphaproteobacteria bacterium]|nr:hypothetical protein [Alphaproteobacteria bacterium]